MFNRNNDKNINFIRYAGWFVVSFFVYFQFLIQTSSSLLQGAWADYYHLTPLGVSLLSASFFYTYLIFQIPVGVIYDRFNEKKVLATASFGLGLGCIIFANTDNYNLAVISRMIMGACAAFGFIGMLKVTANYFPGKQFSLMMGLSESFAALATMCGVIILAWALAHLIWQQLMICFAIGVFTITAAVIVFIRAKPHSICATLEIKSLCKNVWLSITNPTVLVTGIYGFFMASVVNSFTSLWGVAFLTQIYPISATLAAKIMSTVFLGLAVGCPINGYFSKRFGYEREAMMMCAIICAVCMSVVVYTKVTLPTLYMLFFTIGFMCAVYVQSFAIVAQTVPSNIQATSMSVTNMLIMSSAPILQILIGAILESRSLGYAHDLNQNYQIALSILPIGMLIAFILCFLIKSPCKD